MLNNRSRKIDMLVSNDPSPVSDIVKHILRKIVSQYA